MAAVGNKSTAKALPVATMSPCGRSSSSSCCDVCSSGRAVRRGVRLCLPRRVLGRPVGLASFLAVALLSFCLALTSSPRRLCWAHGPAGLWRGGDVVPAAQRGQSQSYRRNQVARAAQPPTAPGLKSALATDGLRLAPLQLASAVVGLLRPFFALQAAFQAGSYDAAEVRAAIEAEVKSAPVVIYSYELSPFSTEAKQLLDAAGADYKEVSLGAAWFLASPEAAAKRTELGAMHG
ncbi:unnamed protein product [Polarella glacialis]|uniref:Uncharacterized protein n=1 Tax=Polarella glacialis TaxID=89957 RepID=A0A813GB98_POLGL|nr:unnamed protein product [Polarella glacialis]CAE8650915.1 unnamed protein product [Polarella glacialis]